MMRPSDGNMTGSDMMRPRDDNNNKITIIVII